MKIRPWRFNTYLLLTFLVVLAVGCLSTDPERKKAREEKKQLSTLRIHLQVSPEEAQGREPVPVFRESPLMVYINKLPFLTEANVASAKVLDVMGCVTIQVEFNHAGLFLLEQYTTANKGRRLVIFSQFGETPEASRWLAAPMIAQRNVDGTLVFTPDATREEAERIVRGLNNAVKKDKKNSWL